VDLTRRLAYFGVSGIFSNIANIATFWICMDIFNVSVALSGSLAYFTGMIVGFSLNHNLTFPGSRRLVSRFGSYLIIQLVVFAFYLLINTIFIANFSTLALFIHIITVVICAGLNFFLINFFWNSNEKPKT